jgi:hypothetical protein
MAQTCKILADKAGASHDSLAGPPPPRPNLQRYQAQFLALTYALRPELAAMLAALAFGGQA